MDPAHRRSDGGRLKPFSFLWSASSPPLRSRSAAASSPWLSSRTPSCSRVSPPFPPPHISFSDLSPRLTPGVCGAGRLRHAAAALTARRHAATSTEEYARRNYADNNSEYNTVIGSLVAQRRQGSVALMIAASRCVLAVRRIAKREAFSLRCLVLVLLLHISRHVLGLVPYAGMCLLIRLFTGAFRVVGLMAM